MAVLVVSVLIVSEFIVVEFVAGALVFSGVAVTRYFTSLPPVALVFACFQLRATESARVVVTTVRSVAGVTVFSAVTFVDWPREVRV